MRNYYCSVCDETFENRYKYSHHCSVKSHKDNVQRSVLEDSSGKRQQDDVLPGMDKNGECVAEIADRVRKDGSENMSDDENSTLKTCVTDFHVDAVEDNDVIEEEVGSAGFNAKQGNADSCSDEERDQTEGDEEAGSTNTEVGADGQTETRPVAQKDVNVCSVCDKTFEHKYLLAKHLLTSFHKNRSLVQPEKHFEMITNCNKCIVRLSPYQCAVCRYYFNVYDELMCHFKGQAHREKCANLTGELLCTLCSFKSSSYEDLEKHLVSNDHIEAIKKKDKAFVLKEVHYKCKCKYCGIPIRNYQRLIEHIDNKHPDRKIVKNVKPRKKGVRAHPLCQFCDRRFTSDSALDRHLQTTHKQAEVKYECKLCDKIFFDVYNYSRHNKGRRHHEKLSAQKKSSLKCELCDMCFKNKKEYIDHVTKSGVHFKKVFAKKNVLNNEEETEEHEEVETEEMKHENKPEIYASEEAALKSREGLEGTQNNENVAMEKGTQFNGEMFADNKHGRQKSGTKKTSENSIKCDHCDFTVSEYDDLRPHYMEKHSAAVKICEPCDLIFINDKGFRIHCNSKLHKESIGSIPKSGGYFFTCEICQKGFESEKYRDFHKAYAHLHINSEEDVLKKFGKNTVTYQRFKDFIDFVETVENPRHKVKCPECDACIQKKAALSHLRMHTGECPFQCKLCEKRFTSVYSLRRHLSLHFKISMISCEVCGREFKKNEYRRRHMKIHAAMDRHEQYTCDVCGNTFPTQQQVEIHRKRHMEKLIACDYPDCHFQFHTKTELKFHKLTHSKVKEFLCDLCAYSANTQYRLNRHKLTHTKERKFHCEYCTYKAGNTTHLRRHMRIHIGAKPFKCMYCDYACNTHENIRKHIRETKKHEGKPVYPCKFCDYGTDVAKEFHKHLVVSHKDEVGGSFKGTALAEFTGLYHRELDPDKPAEGFQIIQLKERKHTRRTKQDDNEEDGEILPAKKRIKTPKDEGKPLAKNVSERRKLNEEKREHSSVTATPTKIEKSNYPTDSGLSQLKVEFKPHVHNIGNVVVSSANMTGGHVGGLTFILPSSSHSVTQPANMQVVNSSVNTIPGNNMTPVNNTAPVNNMPFVNTSTGTHGNMPTEPGVVENTNEHSQQQVWRYEVEIPYKTM